MAQMERKRPYDGDGQDTKRSATGGQIIKILCPNHVTGAIIGTKGEDIKALKARTNAIINVCKPDQQFPGTSERPIAIKGNKRAMMDCVAYVQEKVYDSEKADEERKSLVKLVVPDTSAGRIIGRGGDTVKRLRSTWSVYVSPSGKGETPEDLDERIVNISGEWDNVMGCVDEILDMIVDDPKSVMSLDTDYACFEGFVPTPKSDPPSAGRGSGGPPRGGPPRGGPPRGGRPRGGPPRGGRGGSFIGRGGYGGPPPPPRGGPRGGRGYNGSTGGYGRGGGYGGGYAYGGDNYNDGGYDGY